MRPFVPLLALFVLACPSPRAPGVPDAAQAVDARAAPPSALGEHGPAVSYTLRFPQAAQHLVDVEAAVPTGGADVIELVMATWTPGSYLIREYSAHVEGLAATDRGGNALPVEKTAKNRWRVEAPGRDEIVVRYQVYGRSASVSEAYIDRSLAMLNGAPLFVTRAGAFELPHDVRVELPADWQHTATALAPHPAGGAHHYRAADFDTLLDSPLLAGNLVSHDFDLDGTRYRLVNAGDVSMWDTGAAGEQVRRIVTAHHRFWGVVPMKRYLFLNVAIEGGGGLEHKESTLITTSRWSYRDKSRRKRWWYLVSHEFFHTWNVKRLRPRALGPFDYEKENYTRSLWIAEGLTDYYDALLVRRAGLVDDKDYLDVLSRTIERLQTTPGRLVQPLGQASFDAWIKYYRPDESSVNTSISYYTKGAVVGFVLDAKIRQETAGRKSLDDVMREAYRRFSGERGYRPEEFRALADEVTGLSLSDFFRRAVDTTEELDLAPALSYYGLRFKAPPKREDDAAGWIGLETRSSGDNLVASRVKRGTPAYDAGINVGDELVAVNGYRLHAGDWDARMQAFAPGETVTLLLSRRGQLVTLDVTLAEEPRESWTLEIDPKAGAMAAARRRAWLDG